MNLHRTQALVPQAVMSLSMLVKPTEPDLRLPSGFREELEESQIKEPEDFQVSSVPSAISVSSCERQRSPPVLPQ